MYIEVFNTNFERIAVCDNYESLIWTDRYNEPGDFELYFGMRKELLDIYIPDYYLMSQDSEYKDGNVIYQTVMIIENLKVTTDLEGGDHLIVTGRSLESILCRRIVWTQTTLVGKLKTAVKRLVDQNVIVCKNMTKRKIEEVVWADPNDSRFDDLILDETQFTGDVLYDAIKDLCDKFDVGFWMKRNPNTGKFVFKLYFGTDRSYKQNKNAYVVFSPTFDNIISSDYTENKSKYCNVTLVAGEGEDPNRRTLEVGEVNSSGLNRRELYTDARDLSSVIEEDDDKDEEEEEVDPEGGQQPQEQEEKHMSDKEYNNLLRNRGLEKLKEVEIEKIFDGQVEATQLYRYGKHFFMGDYCELENQYGKESRVKVVEYIHSESTSGIEEYPTFRVIEEKEEEGE